MESSNCSDLKTNLYLVPRLRTHTHPQCDSNFNLQIITKQDILELTVSTYLKSD